MFLFSSNFPAVAAAAASFSLTAASLFIFLDSTSMAFVSASTFFMSICQEVHLIQEKAKVEIYMERKRDVG